MRLASPLVLWAILAAGAGVSALHLLSWQRPTPRWLPTARFVPGGVQRAVSRRIEPSDLALLVLRLVALVAVGLAMAGPVVDVPRSGTARVIVADRSRAIADLQEVRDSVRLLEDASAASRVILFDSLPAQASEAAWRDTAGLSKRGDLDAALIVAARAAALWRGDYDRVVLAIVSPLHAEETSAGTSAIAAAGGVPVEVVRVASRAAPPAFALSSAAWPPATDPIGAALRVAAGDLPGWLRVARTSLDAADSAHAAQGGLVLHWADAGEAERRVEGVLSRSGAVVATLARSGDPTGAAVAWWGDGRPAVGEYALQEGCVREVRVGVPMQGDAVLRSAFQRLVRDLIVPCGWRDERPAAPIVAGAPAATASIASPSAVSPRMRRLLLALALAALTAEWLWRRRRERGATADLLAAGGAP